MSRQPLVTECWPALFKSCWLAVSVGSRPGSQAPLSQGSGSSLVVTTSLLGPSKPGGPAHKHPAHKCATPPRQEKHPGETREHNPPAQVDPRHTQPCGRVGGPPPQRHTSPQEGGVWEQLSTDAGAALQGPWEPVACSVRQAIGWFPASPSHTEHFGDPKEGPALTPNIILSSGGTKAFEALLSANGLPSNLAHCPSEIHAPV